MRILLVDSPLAKGSAVYNALFLLGEVHSVRHVDAVIALMNKSFDIVIINASEIDSINLFVARIHFQKLCSFVVVVVGNPSWRQIRDVFRAGAADCLLPNAPLTSWRSVISEALQGMAGFDFLKEDHEQSYHSSG